MIQKIKHGIDFVLTKLHLIQYREQILYIFVGVETTIVDWILYAVFVLFVPPIKADWLNMISPNIIAYTVAWVGAVLFAYFFSRVFVFESAETNLKKEFITFIGSRIFTLVISIIGDVFLCGKYALIPIQNPFIAKISISILIVVLNYVTSKIFVFKKK